MVRVFVCCHLAQTPQVARLLAEFGGQKRLHKVPSHRRSNGPATHTNNVHVIVFDPLFGGKVVMDESGTNAQDFVGANRRADAAATDRQCALNLAGRNRFCKRED